MGVPHAEQQKSPPKPLTAATIADVDKSPAFFRTDQAAHSMTRFHAKDSSPNIPRASNFAIATEGRAGPLPRGSGAPEMNVQ